MIKLVEVKGAIPGKSVVWRSSLLYGITGVINSPRLSGMAFGGYFRWDKKSSRVLDGQLVDCWGSSTIEGTLANDLFEFVKKYDHRGDDAIHDIAYTFRKDKGLWVGEYGGPATGKGTAQCRLYVTSRDAFYVGCGNPRKPRLD